MGKGGKTTQAAEEAAQLLASDKFRPFLDTSFDAAGFASRSLAETHTTAQAQTEQLQFGVAALDSALRQLVLRNQEDLIAQTARLAEAESAVQRISLSVRSLQMVAARVRAEVAEPYQQIATRTRQLQNLQATVDLLRHVIHRLKLVQRLRQQMGAVDGAGAVRAVASGSGGGCAFEFVALARAQPSSLHRFTALTAATLLLPAGILEVAKAAKLLSEIAAVDAEADLSGIEAVEADADFLQTAAAIVRSHTDVSAIGSNGMLSMHVHASMPLPVPARLMCHMCHTQRWLSCRLCPAPPALCPCCRPRSKQVWSASARRTWAAPCRCFST